jgi:hypothetical protein
LAVALLERFLSANEPLAGDLLEEARKRSSTWFWRQVSFVIFAQAMWKIRMNLRGAIEAVLVASAMLALLAFHAVVAASLLHKVFVRGSFIWIADLVRDWPTLLTVLSLVAAVFIGRTIGRFHGDHRIAAILAFSASATFAAFLNLLLFVPTTPPWLPFFPHAAMQIAVAMMYIAGLFAGIGSRSACEPLPSS